MPTTFRLLCVAATTLFSLAAFSQTGKPRVSAAQTVSYKIGGAKITIDYSSPSVRDRKIWGWLVPYDKVWRAGANEATTFETDAAIRVAGKPLPAGKYGFFLIPRATGPWTAVFNTVSDQWGAFKYDSTKDLLRADVFPRVAADSMEVLAYTIDNAGFSLSWEKLVIPVPVN
jgi:Protein of unknown function (DUF2911)